MAVRLPAWLNSASVSYPAENDRLTSGADLTPAGSAFGVRGGVFPATGAELAVAAQGTPNMTVQVSTGQASVPGTTTATQGTYIVTSDAAANLTIAAANATNPRIDIVVLTVRDSQYSGANNDALLQVITGTPAASPTPPATPASSIVLAQVAVAANATSITNGNITDTRTWTVARGGVLPCLSTAMPSSPYPGMTVVETDTKIVRKWDGSTWDIVYDPNAWTSVTPTLTGMVIGNGTAVMRYKQRGKTVAFTVKVTLGSTSSLTGSVTVSLPTTAAAAAVDVVCTGHLFDASAGAHYPAMTLITAGATNTTGVFCPTSVSNAFWPGATTTAPFAWATGDTITFSGQYETA